MPASLRSSSGCSTLVRVLTGDGRRAARVRAAARVRPGADPAAAARRRAARARQQRADRALLARRRVGRLRRRRPRQRPRGRRPRRGRRAGRARAPLRLAEPRAAPRSAIDERQARAEQPWRDWAAGLQLPGDGDPRGAAQRAHPARALPRADRLDPRRGDDVAAGGDRRRPQLGLPLLLAARRGDDRPRPRRPRLPRGGRGAAALGRRLHRPHRAATRSGCTRSTRSTGSSSGPEAVIDTLPGYAGLPAGAGRQRRQPPDPARRVRARSPTSSPPSREARGLGARRRLARRQGDGRRRSSAAGTSPTTASGRRAWRRATTSTRRSCAGSPSTRALEVQALRGEPADRRLGGAARPDRARTCSMLGWNDAAGAYSVAYGDEDIDASSLWVGLSGLLSDDDPRFLATVLEGRGGAAERRRRLPLPLGRRPARASRAASTSARPG